MHPGEAGKNEISSIGSAYYTFSKFKERAKSKDMVGLKANLQDVKSSQKFVEKNLPDIPKEARENKNGIYSPAHMLNNAVSYMAQTIESGDQSDLGKASIAADQAERLAGYGMKLKEVNNSLKTTVLTGSHTREINRTNVIDIPVNWKESEAGKKFLKGITDFIIARNKGEVITDKDIQMFTDLGDLILTAYKDLKVGKDQAQTYPMAREMILINLALLKAEAKKHIGKRMPQTEKDFVTVQLIRGLYHHDTATEQEQKMGHRESFDKGPTIIDRPPGLQT